MTFLTLLIFSIISAAYHASACTITTASGSKAPNRRFCKGDKIFEDNFDTLDGSKWKHEKTLSGGGNWEFQWYVDDRKNSFTKNGKLHIRPTYTSDVMDIYNGRASIPRNECTDDTNYGCKRKGQGKDIVNPIRSAKITTKNSFAFKYGKMEIRAKNPAGDWLWPAIWMMPKDSVYGEFPRSGEIDVMESRGNRNLKHGGKEEGNKQISSTLHFGPAWNQDAWEAAHRSKSQSTPFSDDFHTYATEWTDQYIKFTVDGQLISKVDANNGFWQRGGFSGKNIWKNKMAPFDQEFFIQLNLAVGGTRFFADNFVNGNGAKPWDNNSDRAMKQFWEGRRQWEPTWKLNTDDRDFQIDYVRVYAV